MPALMYVRRELAVIPLALLAVVACATAPGSGDMSTTTPGPVASPERSLITFDDKHNEWTVISDEINVVLATPDLGVGDQRFALVLSDRQGLVKLPVVEFSSYRYLNGYEGIREGPVQAVFAHFAEFPLGTRGIHVTELNFDSPGSWSVEARVPRSNGSAVTAEVRFTVKEEPESVAVGEAVPPSLNRTLADVSDVADLTTGSFHDEELYRYTVAEAIERKRPFVVVFASPAFCTNAVCGPQVEVVSELRQQYGKDVDFIHIDLFDNPREIQGDLSRAVETPLLDEWGLVSQEWTYVVGADGRVVARFENFAGAEELAEAIESAVQNGRNT